MSKTHTVYRTKAENYARYRWDYAPEALTTILAHTQLARSASVADIGAGTGIFTQQLVSRFDDVCAVEPNEEMREFAEKNLTCSVLGTSAEATGLQNRSIDLITVAQALHWCRPMETKLEFERILRPNGWLAVLHNAGAWDDVGQAIGRLYSAEFGFDPTYNAKRPEQRPLNFYYGHDDFLSETFKFERQETEVSLLGAIRSAANSPDETHPDYQKLVAAVQQIVDEFGVGDMLTVRGETKLALGRMKTP